MDWSTLAAAGFLTSTRQRGTAAGIIHARAGVDLDTALTAADVLDLGSSATLAIAGITDPDHARLVLAALRVPP